MTREEVLPIMETFKEYDLDPKEREALEFSIEALKKRPHGEWIFKHNSSDIWCSNCDENFDEIPQKFLFCPNCGSDNRKRGEAE